MKRARTPTPNPTPTPAAAVHVLDADATQRIDLAAAQLERAGLTLVPSTARLQDPWGLTRHLTPCRLRKPPLPADEDEAPAASRRAPTTGAPTTGAPTTDAAQGCPPGVPAAGAWIEPAPVFERAADVAAALWLVIEGWWQQAAPAATPAEPPDPGPAVAGAQAPLPYDDQSPPLRFDDVMLMGRAEWPLRDLVHCMGLGETGSGKTYSYLLPVLKAALAYTCDGLASSVLVIDPKRELLPEVQARMAQIGRHGQCVVLGQAQAQQPPGRLRLFGGAMQHLSLRDRYHKVCELLPLAQTGSDESSRWLQKGHELNLALLHIDELTRRRLGRSLLCELHRVLGTGCQPRSQWQALDQLYVWVSGMPQLRMVNAFLQLLTDRLSAGQFVPNPLARFPSMGSGPNSDAYNQWMYESRMARMITALAGAPEVVEAIDLDLWPWPDDAALTWETVLEQGWVVVYQPQNTHAANFCARALKAAYFRACMSRACMRRPVFYVVDEFQRFITLDGDSAEASFLDRCRAYRVTCVMATQSHASLLHVIQNKAALDCLLLNMPTVLVFRTRDPHARGQLEGTFAPPRRDMPHVLAVRPIERLETGEYYYASPTRHGRYRARWGAAAQAPARQPA